MAERNILEFFFISKDQQFKGVFHGNGYEFFSLDTVSIVWIYHMIIYNYST